MVENRCYDADCTDENCHNPEHFNYICLDPNCDEIHCENPDHYDKQLLRDYQKSTDLSVYDHREEIDYDEDVDINLCACPDCADDDDHDHVHDHGHSHDHHHDHEHEHHHDHEHEHSHDHHHDHEHEHHHDHEHEHHHDHEHEHHHDHEHEHHHDHEHEHHHDHEHEHSHDHHHDHEHEHHHDHEHEHSHDHHHDHVKEDVCHDDDCGCHDHDHDDDVEFSLCACPDCADDDDHGHDHGHEHAHGDGELLAEGKPLIANRPIQIIVASGILFVLGHIFEWLSFDPTIVTITYMIGAVIAGYEIAILAYKSLVNRHTIGPAMLMCIACVASFIIGHPEEGAAVTFLYYIAEFLEDYAEHRAKRSIKSLVEIAPDTARVKVGDKEEIRNVDEVDIGDIVIVKPGDKVPLDGEVILGSSSINQASITGESVPVLKEVGDEVFSGTVNEDGYLEIKVTKAAKDSVISKIVTLVKRSQLNRSETETLVEKVAKYYTPIMMVAAACVAFIPPFLFGQNLVDWVYKALSLLVISCPCAFLISTPVGMVSAITSATRNGVIIKGSTYVEEMRNVKAVIFDKTGTLTEGKLVFSEVKVLDENYSEDEIVKIASALEFQSSHPIAQAIVNYADENNIIFDAIEDFKNVPGKGIVANINGEQFYAANESLIEGSSFDISREDINRYSAEGKTVVFIGNAEKVIGLITVSDKIRANASEVIADLKDKGVETVMLTGDNKMAARKVANEIGIQHVFSDLLPEDKLNILDTIRNKFGDVAMVGDGINDAPALARANIGIAMGAAGSDVAIETADIALMQDDISKLPYLFALSHKTMGIIKQNITAAIAVKLLCVVLAILGIITLMMSVGFGDLGLTLLVILNSFRIGMVKDPLF
ncbi:ATPase [Methanobrevibacter sp. YE315]|uniref:heavy metal translocating P-type ATPase n=1 Tax=Methanobrevibacter sp. YE315 TaxID=1609968 RepID=UPI000764D0BA|nr:cation-translocating P-type ATPase [Methanobrevibacter sp. YE315]AMD17980.1 ATPase [Methanobrevibacter sp. YE315]